MVQDFVLNQFVQDFVHWRLVHQQNVILGQSLAIFSDYIYIVGTWTEKKSPSSDWLMDTGFCHLIGSISSDVIGW